MQTRSYIPSGKVTAFETSVLVVGSGPAGLLLALQLAKNGVRCMLIERNPDTTKWPKMDITNCRSMELFNRLGIAQGFREQGKRVPDGCNYQDDATTSNQ